MATRHLNGQTVRELRDALGLNLKTLATDIGRSEGYLSKLERGLQQPRPVVIRRIADRLGVTVDSITYPTVHLHRDSTKGAA